MNEGVTSAEGDRWRPYLAARERPSAPVVMLQRWEALLFLHWRFDADVIQASLPPGLRVDTFDGSAWVGVVPFQMRGVRPRGLPAVPGLSHFPELNLRTYVVDACGRPGVWFYSLDTPQLIANWIARTFFHLNYRLARFEVAQNRRQVRYRSQLKEAAGWAAAQCYEWTRSGRPFHAEPGSLEFFLVERYRLFAYNAKRGRLLTGQVHHEPYPIESVELGQYSGGLFESNGMTVPAGPPFHAIASAGVGVEVFPLTQV